MIHVVLDNNGKGHPGQNRSIYLATGVPCRVEIKCEGRRKFPFTFTQDYELIYTRSERVV